MVLDFYHNPKRTRGVEMHPFPTVFALYAKNINFTFDGVFFTLIFDGGGLILSPLFSFVKPIEKVNFWNVLFCMVRYSQIS